jgi:hypothetical protein
MGRDECAECGMLIMDERCSAARVVEVGGRREAQVFDDIGCLLDLERDEGTVVVVERYFRDHETAEWVPYARAAFVVTGTIRTPMASGIVALGDLARAEKKAAETGGVVLDYGALVEARARAVRERLEGRGP